MSRLDEMEMARLMRSGISGDHQAYERLFGQLAPVLERMIGAMAPDLLVAEKEDVVQEAMLSIHAKRHTWQQDRPLLPWVYAITRYRLIDRLRAIKRHQGRMVADIDLTQLVGGDAADRTERRCDLKRQLETLGGKTGSVLFSIGIKGKDIKEVSREEGISENAVRLHYHRGVKKMRALFGDPDRG